MANNAFGESPSEKDNRETNLTPHNVEGDESLPQACVADAANLCIDSVNKMVDVSNKDLDSL